jgi:anti-sigma factor RsiW
MKMSCTHASDETLTLYYYDELRGEERARFAAHMAGCEACARALAEMEEVRLALADRASVRRGEGDWERFMTRLDRAIAAGANQDGPGVAAVATFPTQAARPHLTRYPALAVAAALVMGVALGLLWQQRALDRAAPASTVATAPALAAAERHLDQARLVVLGLAARDAAAAGASDWAYERELAASLLPDTRLFRMAARDGGDARLAELLGDLETVLLQAAMSTEAEPPELQRLQRLIERRDLIGRMDLRDTTRPRNTGATRGFRPVADPSVRGL